MTIHEPSVMISDYVLGLGAFFFGFKSLSFFQSSSRVGQGELRYLFFAFVFLSAGMSAFVGGTVHGFTEVLPDPVIHSMWKVTQVLIGVAAISLLLVLIEELKSVKGVHRYRYVFVTLLGGVYFSALFFTDNFLICILSYLIVLLILLGVTARNAVKTRDAYSKFVALGLFVSLLAAFAQQSGLSLHQYFTHNDLYHTLQLIGFFIVYRGLTALACDQNHPQSMSS